MLSLSFLLFFCKMCHVYQMVDLLFYDFNSELKYCFTTNSCVTTFGSYAVTALVQVVENALIEHQKFIGVCITIPEVETLICTTKNLIQVIHPFTIPTSMLLIKSMPAGWRFFWTKQTYISSLHERRKTEGIHQPITTLNVEVKVLYMSQHALTNTVISNLKTLINLR